MDPEVRQHGGRACPKCSMALDLRTVTFAAQKDPELEDMTRQFWVGAALSIPVLLVAMSDMLPGQPLHQLMPSRTWLWFQFILSTLVVLWYG